MAVRDSKTHKKLDSQDYSSNLHVSTNSNLEAQNTNLGNGQVLHTPNEILEQSSQDSVKLGNNMQYDGSTIV